MDVVGSPAVIPNVWNSGILPHICKSYTYKKNSAKYRENGHNSTDFSQFKNGFPSSRSKMSPFFHLCGYCWKLPLVLSLWGAILSHLVGFRRECKGMGTPGPVFCLFQWKYWFFMQIWMILSLKMKNLRLCRPLKPFFWQILDPSQASISMGANTLKKLCDWLRDQCWVCFSIVRHLWCPVLWSRSPPDDLNALIAKPHTSC